MSAGLGIDSSDPLNLLLQNGDSSSDESSQSESSQDWSKFSTLWADNSEQSMKPYADIMDFADLSGMPMDMDFNPSMTMETSALNYDPIKFSNFSFDDQFNTLSTELLTSQFPFTFQSAISSSDLSGSPQPFTKERRLSITSSSSSSGASLSPVPESVPSPAPGYTSDTIQPKEEPCSESYVNDPAAELAQRVRESAGVMMAVPMSTQLHSMGVQVPMTHVSQGKLPIPRLPRNNSISIPKSSTASLSSSAASTPPPSTPTSAFKSDSSLTYASSIGGQTAALPPPGQGLPRPKTSHTTIERRYRTNLNARIQSLRMAVPALRVLEDREGGNGKKIKKNVKGSVIIKSAGDSNIESDENAGVDVIDERGFVDGVKVARKCSKANVLGKAVEYIRVLKKREQRLKSEQAGLKTLISGLVGGPALVREWEREWRAKFGGEEKDEVEGEDEEGDDDDSDEEDGEDGEDDGARKRKRAKLASSTAKKTVEKEKKKPAAPVLAVAVDASGNAMPEKRKRGRPRKILPPPVSLVPSGGSPSDNNAHDEVMQPSSDTQAQWSPQQAQPQQFLLAVFALFSFFNSPLTSSSPMHHTHQHAGTVLTAQPPLAYSPDIVSQFSAPVASSSATGWPWNEYIQLFQLFVSVIVLASFVGGWFGLSFGSHLEKAISRSRRMSTFSLARPAPTFDRNAPKVGPTNWVELGEECVLQGRTTSLSFYERVQIYRAISSSKSHASVTDLVTLSLVVRGVGGFLDSIACMKAQSIWASAVKKAHPKFPIKVSEKLVFDTLDIDDAATYLSRATQTDCSADDEGAYTPLQVLGTMVVEERIKQHLATLFVASVEEVAEKSDEAPSKEDPEWRKTIDASRELGGHVEELGKLFEHVWKSDNAVLVDDADLVVDVTDGEGESSVDKIKALLVALILYRELFPAPQDEWLSSSTSTLLSPPPTPTSKASIKRREMLRSLRTVLGNRVFEDVDLVQKVSKDGETEEKSIGLEDTRDRVVDMIFDAERPLRVPAPSM